MADIIDARTNDLVWRGKVMDTINGVGQSEKQSDQAAKDLVSKFVKDAKKVDKNLAKKSACSWPRFAEESHRSSRSPFR